MGWRLEKLWILPGEGAEQPTRVYIERKKGTQGFSIKMQIQASGIENMVNM